MQKPQVSGVQLLKPGEYPAIVLHLVDEAFDQMALPIQMPVIVGGPVQCRVSIIINADDLDTCRSRQGGRHRAAQASGAASIATMDPAPVCAPFARFQRIMGGVGSSRRQSCRFENHRLAGCELSLGMISLDIQIDRANADLSVVGLLVGGWAAADAGVGSTGRSSR